MIEKRLSTEAIDTLITKQTQIVAEAVQTLVHNSQNGKRFGRTQGDLKFVVPFNGNFERTPDS